MSDPELPQAEHTPEREPRYLRRQKPVEIRRRKFGKEGWRFYAKTTAWVVASMATAWMAWQTWEFLMYSPRFLMADLELIQVSGNRFVPRAAVLERFSDDEGTSVFRIPLDRRRAALEEIPWVERASVQRVLPRTIQVQLVERTPVAFLRSGTELALIDAYGVVLERPLEGDFRFPVVTGINEDTPARERRKRIYTFGQLLADFEGVRPGAADSVSEVDLSDPADLRVTLTALPELGKPGKGGQASLLVHFGESEFAEKFRVVLENLAQWRKQVGRVYSVDLRFDRQVVVNPETPPVAGQGPAAAQGFGKQPGTPR